MALLLAGALPAQAQNLDAAQRAAWKRPDTIPFPAANPYTPEKAALGKMLFFDTRLSRDKNLSCASCHNPRSDGRCHLRAPSARAASRWAGMRPRP
jgi:cytochrome c peroxidase